MIVRAPPARIKLVYFVQTEVIMFGVEAVRLLKHRPHETMLGHVSGMGDSLCPTIRLATCVRSTNNFRRVMHRHRCGDIFQHNISMRGGCRRCQIFCAAGNDYRIDFFSVSIFNMVDECRRHRPEIPIKAEQAADRFVRDGSDLLYRDNELVQWLSFPLRGYMTVYCPADIIAHSDKVGNRQRRLY